MKILLPLAVIFFANSAFGQSCDVGLIRMSSSFGPADYNPEVFSAFRERGYNAHQVRDSEGARSFEYSAEVSVDCQSSSATDPNRSVTVTTLSIYRTKGRKLVFKLNSRPQPAYGSCHVGLRSLIGNIPYCGR